MNADQWQRVKELCVAALTFAPPKREAYLEQECDGDLRLLDEVRSLLAVQSKASNCLGELPREFVAAAFENDVSLVGRKIGNYDVRTLLGRGGMGEVYLAEDRDLRRKVALKVLPEELTRDTHPLQRFKQEARAASGLKHRNIITIYSVGQEDGVYFIAAEYVNGLTLRQRLMSSGRLELKDAIEIGIQVGSGLEAAHNAGIVHRDVKPENIMFESDGTAKLLDFGIAKLTETLGPENVSSTQPFKTEQGIILGTPAYMSPEQARHQPLDHRSDLFSLGVVLYEMITGKVPFSGGTPYDQQAAVLVGEPTPINQHLDKFVPELQWVLSKALTKEPERRYQSATDFLIDLQMLHQRLQDEDVVDDKKSDITDAASSRVTVIADNRPLRKRRWTLTAIVMLLLVALLAAALISTRAGQRLFGLIGPPPVIESIVPTRPIDVIGNQPIELRGRNFEEGLKIKVGFPNGGSGELSGAQIQKQEGDNTTLNILIDLNGNPGIYTLQLLNPDGQVSSPFTFEARHETQRPSINWIEPAVVKKSGGEQVIAVYGSNFQQGVSVDVVQPNGETSQLSGRQIANQTPNSFHGLFFFYLPGKHSIRVINPSGGKSEYYDIVVQ
jgi:serine/threonine protein kinase